MTKVELKSDRTRVPQEMFHSQQFSSSDTEYEEETVWLWFSKQTLRNVLPHLDDSFIHLFSL